MNQTSSLTNCNLSTIWLFRSVFSPRQRFSPSTINTTDDDFQPHLYYDSGVTKWYLYFTATNPADGKLAIYRAQQQITGNWDSWGTKELVIGAGNAVAIGEPSLTDKGDISFVVIYQRANGGVNDKYEADPWLMVKQ